MDCTLPPRKKALVRLSTATANVVPTLLRTVYPVYPRDRLPEDFASAKKASCGMEPFLMLPFPSGMRRSKSSFVSERRSPVPVLRARTLASDPSGCLFSREFFHSGTEQSPLPSARSLATTAQSLFLQSRKTIRPSPPTSHMVRSGNFWPFFVWASYPHVVTGPGLESKPGSNFKSQ